MKKSVVLPLQDEHDLCPFSPGKFDEDLEAISEYGYDGVELGITDPEGVSVSSTVKSLNDKGLELSALTTGQAYGVEGISITERNPGKRKMARERLKSHIDFATNFENTPVILGSLRGEGGPQVASRWLIENLAKLSDYAEEKGVDIAFEPLNRYESSLINTMEEGLEVIEEVGSSRLGLLFDTFHANIEEPSLTESIKKTSQKIIYVHLADSNRWAPGYGHIDFAKVISSLRDNSYDDFCSLESLPKPDKESSLKAPFKI